MVGKIEWDTLILWAPVATARAGRKAGPESQKPGDSSDGGRRTSTARERTMTITALRDTKAGSESQTLPPGHCFWYRSEATLICLAIKLGG